MPELPEIETTLRGIEPHIKRQIIDKVIVRHPRLRWPIPDNLPMLLQRQPILNVTRRGKYLLLETPAGTIILHLGMSGSLRILNQESKPGKHDHLDFVFANQTILRLTDPRRFGACLWTTDDPAQHPLLMHLGPEPLTKKFSGKYLLERARSKKMPVKSFIMDSKIVVGVGNIYAAEALFAAEIHPKISAGKITLIQFEKLSRAIKKILTSAIHQGGTTLKDFVKSDGKPGYFKLKLKVYGREGLSCVVCKTILKGFRLGQRATVYCEKCQNF